jgi:hypothetical protein
MNGERQASSFFFRHFSFATSCLLGFVTLLLFNRFLSPSGHWVLSRTGDMTSQFVWWRQFGFEELKKGHLALWNPHLFCGVPFFGGFQSALLYPPNWLFMALPLGFAINFSIALHVFLAGFFTFLWLKGRKAHPASALLGAFMFMFSGAFFTRIVVGQISNLCTIPWIPLVFLALDKVREEWNWKWIFLGWFALAMQFFSGHVQYCYYTGMIAFFYVLLSLKGTDRKPRFLSAFVLMYGGAALLAAVQLLAGWDAAFQSVRTQRLSIDILDMADMTLERVWCFLMPNFFGSWDNYWGGGMYCEGHPFVSVTGFVLALFALKASPRPEKKIFGGLALFMTILSFGKRTPLFILFAKYFPLFGHFRGVSKLNVLTTLCLVALAAMGLDEIFKRVESLKSLDRGARWGSLALLLASVVFYATPRVGGGKLFKQFLSHADEMSWSLFCGGLALGAIAFIAFLSLKKPGFRWAFLVFAFAELFTFGWANRPSFDLQALKDKVSLIQKTYDRDPGDYRVWVDNANYTLGTKGFDVWGEDPINLYRYARFAAATQGYDLTNDALKIYFFQKFPPALELLRLRYVFRDKTSALAIEKTGLKEVPRAFFVSRFQVLKDEEILSKTVNHQFNPREEVLLESDPGIAPVEENPRGDLTVSDINTDKLEIKGELSKPALLVISDNYSKGWKTRELGNPVGLRVMPANGFQRAIPLQAGKFHFFLEYRPTAYVIGKWISLFSWLVFGGLLAWKKSLFF